MTDKLPAILDRFAAQRILVLGDLMLDRFVYGAVDRISPEAPIPVMRVLRETVTLGGAGNVVRNLAALGTQIDIIGVAGQDQAGYELAKQFASLPGVTPLVLTDAARPTTLKTRYISGSQQLLRADMETAAPLGPALEEQVLLRMQAALPAVQVVVLSDYAKGVLTDKIVAGAITQARAQNKKLLIDPKGRDYSRYRNAFMLTPNRKELTEATGVDAIRTIDQAEQAARALIAAYNLEGVLAKLGGDGVCLVMKDQPALHIHGMAKEVFDVSGAGDTVIAVLALALAARADLTDSAYLANLAGSIVVGKVGTATVTVDDMLHELHDTQVRQQDAKLANWHEALEQVEKWRQKELKVGFTNGCFDLIHPGHLSLLRQARTRCDRLVVGLNTDASIQRLKGPTRPVQNETARATVLAAMSDVDLVVLFDQDTPVELLKLLRPDLLVKGADYSPDQVVGWDLVQGWGGELFLADLIDGHSTTAMIARSQTRTVSGQ